MKVAVVTFARASIPHKGHEKLFNAINKIALEESGDPLIFLSHSFDAKKNPVSYDNKVTFLTSCGVSVKINNEVKDMFGVLRYCKENKYDKVIFVVGSDRVEEVKKRVAPYLGKTDENGLPFEFEVRSAGNRALLEGISGTKMRSYILSNDFDSFKKWLPSKTKHEPACKLWAAARYNTYSTL